MAQFDVYANAHAKTNKAYPYLVDVQNDLLDGLNTRIVIPLATADTFKQTVIAGLTPAIRYQDEELLLLVPHLSSIPAKLLTKPIGNLTHLRNDIIAALDLAITGI